VLIASSEFTLKSSPVRRTLEQRLIDDLRFALTRAKFERSRVEKEAARLVVFGARESETAALVCSKIFGVAYAAPAQLLTNPSLGDVAGTIVRLALQRLQKSHSFAVRAHRSTPGSISRRDVELSAGAEVLKAMEGQRVRVDLEDPNQTFYVDLVGNDAYVYCEKLQGPGGLPLSSQWKMLAVLDSGPLTLLAACAMMRRGCVVELFIPLSDTIDGLATRTQLNFAERLGKLVTRPNYKAFTVQIDQISPNGRGNAKARSVDWRELIRMAALRFAKEKRFRAVVFGDIAGSLGAIGASRYAKAELPVFYPLLGMEREDLGELSRLASITESELISQEELEVGLPATQFNEPSGPGGFSDLVVREMLL
jgi:thiamine biosynthesis protein ThiI